MAVSLEIRPTNSPLLGLGQDAHPTRKFIIFVEQASCLLLRMLQDVSLIASDICRDTAMPSP